MPELTIKARAHGAMTDFERQLTVDMSLIMAGLGLLLMQNASPHARQMASAFQQRTEQMRAALEQDSLLRSVMG